ncbi:sugar O-acetyltransferase [Oxalobacter sp. OttesenSCG-928-P03]|nr:sugar O-acetyltransferase [Oxalobacter sp. OttesenSCG-928-P03]
MTQTQKERMIAGLDYSAGDPELQNDRLRAQTLTQAYNATSPDETEKKSTIMGLLLKSSGTNLSIVPPFYCDYGYNITVGDNFYSNFSCIILDCAPVTIGNNVMLGPKVQIYTATHPIDPDERKKGLEFARPVTIEDDVWIGGGTIINPGVTIGRGTTIGSGSVVTHDIPPNVVAVGNPCMIIRKLD